MIDILKGDIIFNTELNKTYKYKNSYIVVEDGLVEGIYDALPNKYNNIEVRDYGNSIIIPAFNDLHAHAPQWTNAGNGHSMQLLEWLSEFTFPLEEKYADLEYARQQYEKFTDELIRCGTMRSCIFATIHKDATYELMKIYKKKGIGGYIGKVNMDRNSSEGLTEDTKTSVNDTLELIEKTSDFDEKIKFIITPRFVPSTSSELMFELGVLAQKYNIKIQSHLNENKSEIEWVRKLHPECKSFADVYKTHNLLRENNTVMAHCIHNTDEETMTLIDREIFIAHAPQCNFNITSGIMPARKYLDMGAKIGLASDVGGGYTLDMRQHIIAALQASKTYEMFYPQYKQLAVMEAFYLATRGSGRFFGNVGSFEKGFEFDALVIDDSSIINVLHNTLEERLERYIYRGTNDMIVERFIKGVKL